ncbi:MAG TPA: TonB-dependent receptor [Gallionella sp.]|nr:TonB-dependent receptor [Gallionella sp.]
MSRKQGVGRFGLVAGLLASAPVWAEEPQALPEVKVVGQVDATAERREAVTQKVVLECKEIENLGVMTIGEVLTKLPGVEVTPMGGGQRARGMSRDSVQILIDGERSAGGGAMVAGVIGRLPSGDLERVEILRGASAEFGGAAPVTVNLVMKKALAKKSAEVRVGVGRRGNESYNQLAFTKNGGSGGFAWTLPIGLTWSNSPAQRLADRQDTLSGLRTIDSERGVTRLGHHSIAPRLTWKDGKDSLTVAPLFFYGPQDTTSETQLTPGMRISDESNLQRLLRLRTEGEKHFGDAKFSGRAAVNKGRRTSDIVRTAGLVSTAEHTASTENEFSFALRLDQPVGEHLLAFGLEHVNLRRTQDQVLTGIAATYIASERQSIAWVQDDWMLRSNATLTYGLRGETIALNSSAIGQQHGRVMPSVALRWEPQDKWVMRSSFGAGLKMPKLDEISNAATPSVGTNTPLEADKRGNPNLLPERSLNFEAVLERYLDKDAGLFGVNLYARATQDFTERRAQLEGLRWVDRPYNEGRALHWGWELDGKVRTDSFGWKGATIKAHLTLPHARVNDTRLGLTRMARDTPKYVLLAGLDESLPKLQSSYGISLQLSGRSLTDIPGEQRVTTRARTTLDAFWLYKLTPQFNLRLSGQNLLATDTVRDAVFFSGGSTWQLHNLEGGYRTVMATLEGRW